MVSPLAAIEQSGQLANQVSGNGTIQRVTQAIKQASARTGVDFSYLMNKASQESGFNPNAKASGSSATGLYQFTSQTWLQTVKTYGGQFGFGQYAADISVDSNGVAHVNNPANKQAILALRSNPTVSAEMAGELDQQNFAALKSSVGGTIGPTDLYLAHFLGVGGASSFINTLRSNPNATAANILPDAAAANPSVFYNKSGSPRTVEQIYQQFADKFDHAPQIPGDFSATQVASNTTSMPTATSFTVADAANTIAHSSYTPSAMGGLKASSPSLYETMVLAQMNMHESDLQALDMSGDAIHKKNPIANFGALA